MSILKMIAAVGNNNIIGLNNQLPWYNKDEIRFFRDTTINNCVLMGRKTFESIGKPLKDRENVVISSKEIPGVITINDLFEAISYCKYFYHTIFIIGGASIYKQTMDHCDELIISRIPYDGEGDTYFPEINMNIWELFETENYNSFTVERYLKKDATIS